jgi:hypothetical protein
VVTELKKRLEDMIARGDQYLALHLLADRHPRILKKILDEVDGANARAQVRKAMPPHPATPHPTFPDIDSCFWKLDGVNCHRRPGDPLHVAESATNTPAAPDA